MPKRLMIVVLMSLFFVLLTVPVQAETVQNVTAVTGEAAAVRKPTLLKGPQILPAYREATVSGQQPKAAAGMQQKLLLQNQEKQKWEAFRAKLDTQKQLNDGKDNPLCSSVDSLLTKQTTAVDKNYVKASGSYREASQRAHNTVRIARQYLGDDAATAEGMLQLFDEKIALFESQSQTFQEQQQNTQQYACNVAKGKFSVELKKLQDTGAMNRKSTQDIITYYEKTLRPELAKLGEKLKAMNVPQSSSRPVEQKTDQRQGTTARPTTKPSNLEIRSDVR